MNHAVDGHGGDEQADENPEFGTIGRRIRHSGYSTMRTLTIEDRNWPQAGWTAAKYAAVVQFVQLRHLATKRPEEEAYERVKNLPEKLQEAAFVRCIERFDTPLPSAEQAVGILVQPDTVRYMLSLVCPECPRESVTEANAMEVYFQLLPTPPTKEEKAEIYGRMFDLVARAARGEAPDGG